MTLEELKAEATTYPENMTYSQYVSFCTILERIGRLVVEG